MLRLSENRSCDLLNNQRQLQFCMADVGVGAKRESDRAFWICAGFPTENFLDSNSRDRQSIL
ncbi:hypothetical protein [Coleofasciculus sp. H7-2]|uniref:hypothetical protein n=1 Tax=Coleofasciculus sp. H7-2 TaxID=3351545 RepID=UPI00367115CC